MNRPILVRVREGDVDRRQFVVEANEQSVASMSATEQAVADAERITPGMMNLFMPSETGDILTPANRDFIRRFMEEIVGPAERGEYMTDDGQLSLAGVTRIRNAVFQKAYGDPETLSLIAESTDNNVRNVTNAMLIAAPRLADMRDRIAEGSLYNLDPSEDLTAAVRKLSSLRAEGQDVETYLRQVTMFEDDLSPLAKDFLVIFDRHKRSQKRLGAILRTYTEIVESLGDPKQELCLMMSEFYEGRDLQAAVKRWRPVMSQERGKLRFSEVRPLTVQWLKARHDKWLREQRRSEMRFAASRRKPPKPNE